jgi:hypothetical protein
MNLRLVGLLSVLIMALSASLAGAWSHANTYGGSSHGTYGQGFEHSNAWGGNSAHLYGGGSEHTNMYGGRTVGEYGAGAVHTNQYGASTYGHYGYGTYGASGYHPPYYGANYSTYHPPTTVNYYSASCSGCGGWNSAGAAAAGAAVGMGVGMAAGAAVASANSNAEASNAYASGYEAGASQYAMGAIYPTVPSDCATPAVGGITYYLCGNTWFQPSYGANGVYYRVVPPPY